MKICWYKHLTLVAGFLALAQAANAEIFECAFISDKYSTGKSNRATCSMLPEVSFSKRDYTPPKDAHCQVEPIYDFEDLEDVLVDTDIRIVSWKLRRGLTVNAQEQQERYYLAQGHSKGEAKKKSENEEILDSVFTITSYEKSTTKINTDEITGKLLDPPKEIPEHHLILKNNHDFYYLYIPEASGHPILAQFSGVPEASWISIRFGKCRKKG